jgi:hypothetical protein
VAPGSDPAELDSAKHRYQVEYEQVCGIQNLHIPRSEFLEACYWVSSPRSHLEIFSMRFSFPTTSLRKYSPVDLLNTCWKRWREIGQFFGIVLKLCPALSRNFREIDSVRWPLQRWISRPVSWVDCARSTTPQRRRQLRLGWYGEEQKAQPETE